MWAIVLKNPVLRAVPIAVFDDSSGVFAHLLCALNVIFKDATVIEINANRAL